MQWHGAGQYLVNDLSWFASTYPEHPCGQGYLWCLAESSAPGLFAGRAARLPPVPAPHLLAETVQIGRVIDARRIDKSARGCVRGHQRARHGIARACAPRTNWIPRGRFAVLGLTLNSTSATLLHGARMATFGARIQNLRKTRRLTQRQLAGGVAARLTRTIRGDRDSAPGRRRRNRTRSRTTGNDQWAAIGTFSTARGRWLSAEWT